MSLLKVKEPVLLNDDPQHPIQVFICLAAVDNELHLKALASLTKILSNNEKLTALLSATTADQIIEVIREGEDENEICSSVWVRIRIKFYGGDEYQFCFK